MRHNVISIVLALVAIFAIGTAHAGMHIAYAHISLSIQYGGNEPPTYSLDGSIYPGISYDATCTPARCIWGMATPFGYVYDPYHFDPNPEYHGEEIHHIKQWEALGPAFLLSYLMTGGEAFEPYDIRGVVPASRSTPRWDFDRMWNPPSKMERSFPQFRITWGGEQQKAHPSLYPGYTNVLNDTFHAILN